MPEVVPLPEPVVIPQTQQKTFDTFWIREIQIRTIEPTAPFPGGDVLVVADPMNSTTFETLPSGRFAVRTPLLMKAAAEVPEVAAAMQAICAAIFPLKAWVEQNGNAIS